LAAAPVRRPCLHSPRPDSVTALGVSHDSVRHGRARRRRRVRGRHLVNGKSDKLASIANGGSYEEGTKVIQWFDNGGSEQYWFFEAVIIDA
jgi:hypothetical protein